MQIFLRYSFFLERKKKYGDRDTHLAFILTVVTGGSLGPGMRNFVFWVDYKHSNKFLTEILLKFKQLETWRQ